MKQIFQDLKTGRIDLSEVPAPQVQPHHLLIRGRAGLISSGTERTLLEFGKANPLEKMRRQPDKVRMVWEKLKSDGIFPTMSAVMNKLDRPLPMGYCHAGEVIEVGRGVTGFRVGDRVASNGPHAEVACAPANLSALVPEGVTDEEASFTVLGAVALQGVRLAQPTLGERFVVMGLGLVGVMAAQILEAHGLRVLGMDYDQRKLDLAKALGIETLNLADGGDPVAHAMDFSHGRGVDGVLIAAATERSDPVRDAPKMCRKRGRIILTGVSGLHLSRADFYEKELSFQVSCAYGPGRYDPNYEQQGNDYPYGYVRWTAQRNFEAVLELMADGRLAVAPLISHRFEFSRAEDAYRLLTSEAPSMGIVLLYGDYGSASLNEPPERTVTATPTWRLRRPLLPPTVGVIGTGAYACGFLIPAFKKTGVTLKTAVSLGGASSAYATRKFGFLEATTNMQRVIQDKDINVAVIATRHDSHAKLVCENLKAGKHVFVEKPPAVNRDQFEEIRDTYETLARSGDAHILMVGFNRRFAPHIRSVKRLLETDSAPKRLVYTVNAGFIPVDHWTRDPEVGGGRVIGEMCHFIDLLRFLVGVPSISAHAERLGAQAEGRDDSVTATFTYADGSSGAIHYLANGPKSLPKERLDIFCGGKALELSDFRTLKGFGWKGFRRQHLWRRDKGVASCVESFVEAVRSGAESPIPFEEIVEVMETTFRVNESLTSPITGE